MMSGDLSGGCHCSRLACRYPMDPISEGLKKELQITELDAPLGDVDKADIVGAIPVK